MAHLPAHLGSVERLHKIEWWPVPRTRDEALPATAIHANPLSDFDVTTSNQATSKRGLAFPPAIAIYSVPPPQTIPYHLQRHLPSETPNNSTIFPAAKPCCLVRCGAWPPTPLNHHSSPPSHEPPQPALTALPSAGDTRPQSPRAIMAPKIP